MKRVVVVIKFKIKLMVISGENLIDREVVISVKFHSANVSRIFIYLFITMYTRMYIATRFCTNI